MDYAGLSQTTIELLLGRETTDVEYKQRFTKDEKPAEYFVAFANSQGGVILLGVARNKEIIGYKENDDDIRQGLLNSADACRPSIVPLISIYEDKTAAGKRIYRIDILEGNNKPYCTNGGLYKIRDDGQNRAIYPDEMKQIILKSNLLPAKINRLEQELESTRHYAENLAKTIPSENELGYILARKIRGF